MIDDFIEKKFKETKVWLAKELVGKYRLEEIDTIDDNNQDKQILNSIQNSETFTELGLVLGNYFAKNLIYKHERSCYLNFVWLDILTDIQNYYKGGAN